MDYNEIAKIFNEQGWKLNHILIVFAIGIIAFSIQTIEKNITYNYTLPLYISWGAFSITFILGFIRFHIMQKAITLQAKKMYDYTVKKKEVPLTTDSIQKKSHQSHILYLIMFISFFIGLVSFAIFKLNNIQ